MFCFLTIETDQLFDVKCFHKTTKVNIFNVVLNEKRGAAEKLTALAFTFRKMFPL